MFAKKKIMVDIHDDYRPSGWQRTLPSLMSVEGVRGDEEFPSVKHDLISLFTRMLGGPADHTFAFYDINKNKRNLTNLSPGVQVAKSIVFFSPWQFLFWYDSPMLGKKMQTQLELDYFQNLPTIWDDTRVLHGEIGVIGVIARRKGNHWWIGCLGAFEDTRNIVIEVGSLIRQSPQKQDSWIARVYSDETTGRYSKLVMSDYNLVASDSKSTTSITVSLSGSIEKGSKGAAIWLCPKN